MAEQSTHSKRDLDPFDRAILRIIQRDNKTPQREIAERVNLSPAAVQRRIAAMEKTGVIATNVAVLDAHALSVAITAVVEVHLRDERTATVDAAKRLFRECPEVQQCYYVTGGVSFVLVIACADMRAFEVISRKLFQGSDLVERSRSLIALDRVKADLSLVIP
ncbi:Lrp/AsnC family transcriptional regulator [Sphingomonas carotinifaciens]|uniref:Lrp/AsnC family transcriptional regulator n=1 Tax=Sphingomonas carotinifaciens TaxID=1166323 RepID=UPI000DDAC461|nr:Lrp/AsnC family transcriptional regulator [Sphingomonas carotinifaciens]